MKTVVLGVTGSIAAYKAPEIVRAFVKAGVGVRVVMTKSACELVAPLALERVSENPVAIDMFATGNHHIEHISLAQAADVFLIAPCTANVIGKIASGIADDLLTTTAMATTAPILIAPAMNDNMYLSPANQHNMDVLRERGVGFIDPGVGDLACGTVGVGRLADIGDIVETALRLLDPDDSYAGRSVLVTAGPTQEAIDPVRYITNRSSGKMGYAIAREAVRRGAKVTLVTGKVSLSPVKGAEMVAVESVEDMRRAVLSRYDAVDVVIKAAAPADYRVERVADQKIKKQDEMTLRLVKTPDILKELGEKKTHQFLVGFAAETQEVSKYAKEKLRAKNLDLIVANDVSKAGAGFDGDTNEVTLYGAEGETFIPLCSKDEVAAQLLDYIDDRLRGDD